MSKEIFYKVPKQRLIQLLEAELYNMALDSGGVDNWSGIGFAMDDFLEQEFHGVSFETDDTPMKTLAERDLVEFEVID